MTAKDFQHISYELHRTNKWVEKEPQLNKNWFANDTVDVWRHTRMLAYTDIFLNKYKGAKWLTVGDNSFAAAAIYITDRGGNAVATDINTSYLKIAKEKNLISDYVSANAESLPFEDNSFDFSFCKEAFHHFPRAYLGLYEMLRVSRKAVILVEPCDWLPPPIPLRLLQIIKNIFRTLANIKIPHPDTGNYETAGNYVFTVSEREIQKIALGLNLPCVAFKKFHDIYIAGMGTEKADTNSLLFKKLKKEIFINHILFQMGLSGKNLIAATIFKENPDNTLRTELKRKGFKTIDLPGNPYADNTIEPPEQLSDGVRKNVQSLPL